MGSFYGEGRGEGIWVLYQGKRCWLSMISKKLFKDMKEKAINSGKLTFCIEKNGEDLSARLNQLELAESV